MRQRQEFGEQGHRLVQRQLGPRQEGLELLERRTGRLTRAPRQPALEQISDGIQGGVLVRGRPLALYPRMGLTSHAVFQHLHQARFAHAGLARQHHHLAHAGLHSLPALHEECHFRCPSHQRRQTASRSDLEATLDPAGPQHAIHSQGLRPTTERLLLKRLTREIALDEVIRRSGDRQRIGRRQVLQPRRKVRRLPQR